MIDREDSPDSDKCPQYSNDDSDSEFGASVSEGDSSDVDEEEYERRKSLYFTEMADLERQFVALKEQLYLERLSQAEKKLEEVKAGRAQEYLQPLEELQENMRVRTEVAGILKQLKLANARCQYEAESLAAKQHLESERAILKEQIRQDVEEKLKRLEEDRNSIDSEIWGDVSLSKKRKKYGTVTTNGYEYGPGRDQLNLPDRRRKPVTVSGPFVVYMLKESDILEDWNFIRKAIKAAGSVNYF